MGPNMLIMAASYRDRGLSARLICNLASVIRSATPSWSLPVGASGIRHNRLFGQENALLRHQKYMYFTPSPHLVAVASVHTHRRGLGSIQTRGSLPLRQKLFATTTHEKTL